MSCLISKTWKSTCAYPNQCFQGFKDHVLVLFGFLLCSVAKPQTRHKPLFSLVILVRFWLSWIWQNCSFVGVFDSCCAQRSQNKKAFSWMEWWRFVCLLLPPGGKDCRFTPFPWNLTNFHISSLGLWLFYFLLFLSFFLFHCFHLNFFYEFISSWNPATRMRQHSSSDPSSAGAQGLLCVLYIRQSCLQTQGFWFYQQYDVVGLCSAWLTVTPALYFCTAASQGPG